MSTVSLHWFSDLARSVTPTFVKNFIIRNQGVNQFVSSIYSANGQLFVVFFPQTEGDLFLHSAWILINWDFPNLYWGCRERHFRRLNCWFSLQDRLCQPCPAALAAGNQPARHKHADFNLRRWSANPIKKNYLQKTFLYVVKAHFPATTEVIVFGSRFFNTMRSLFLFTSIASWGLELLDVLSFW
jgi:hypothetical protein